MKERSPLPLALPAVVWLAVFWAWPLLLVFSMSFREMDDITFVVSGFTLSHFKEVLTDSFHLEAVFRSLRLAALATLLAGVLGYPAALHISRTQSERARAVFMLILMIPIMISLVVTAFAWILILGPNGFLNQIATALHLSSEPIQFLNSESGVLIVLVYSFGPYMVINIVTALDRIDPAIVRAAQVHGATAWETFRRITLPLSFPGILSGGLIVFSLSAAAFVTPYIIGGNRVKVVPLQIYNAAVTTFDWPIAATLSVVLFILAMVLATLVARLSERRFAGWAEGRAVKRAGIIAILAWITYALIVVPVVMVIGASFTETRYIAFPPQGLTFRWYAVALSDSALVNGLGLSATVAAASVAMSLVLGTMGALYLSKARGRIKESLAGFFLAPLNVPAVMTAFALLLAFTQWHLINWAGLVIAHSVIIVPYIVRSVLVSLAGQDPAIQRAASSLGASPLRVFRHVTLPLIKPGVIAGGTFAFLISFNNVPVSVFLASPGSAPLPVVLFNRMQWLAEPSVAAAATVTVLTTLAVMLALERRFSFYKSLFR